MIFVASPDGQMLMNACSEFTAVSRQSSAKTNLVITNVCVPPVLLEMDPSVKVCSL